MAKNESQDIQILQTMIKLQVGMNDLIEDTGEVEEIVKDDKVFKVLYFDMINLLQLTKNLSNKTKKAALHFMDDFKSAVVLEDLTYCYPRLSKEEIIKYAAELSNEESQYILTERHVFCVEKVSGKEEK